MLHLAEKPGAAALILAQLFASVLAAALVTAVVGLPLRGTILMPPKGSGCCLTKAMPAAGLRHVSRLIVADRDRSRFISSHAAEDDARDVPSRVARAAAGP